MKMKYIHFICLIVLAINAAETSCDSDSDCKDFNSCKDEECIHKDFLSPEPAEIVGIFLLFTVALIANAGGVGGGPLLTPILLLLMNFDTRYALPLV